MNSKSHISVSIPYQILHWISNQQHWMTKGCLLDENIVLNNVGPKRANSYTESSLCTHHNFPYCTFKLALLVLLANHIYLSKLCLKTYGCRSFQYFVSVEKVTRWHTNLLKTLNSEKFTQYLFFQYYIHLVNLLYFLESALSWNLELTGDYTTLIYC